MICLKNKTMAFVVTVKKTRISHRTGLQPFASLCEVWNSTLIGSGTAPHAEPGASSENSSIWVEECVGGHMNLGYGLTVGTQQR